MSGRLAGKFVLVSGMAHAAGKAGVIGLTRSLAHEYAADRVLRGRYRPRLSSARSLNQKSSTPANTSSGIVMLSERFTSGMRSEAAT